MFSQFLYKGSKNKNYQSIRVEINYMYLINRNKRNASDNYCVLLNNI